MAKSSIFLGGVNFVRSMVAAKDDDDDDDVDRAWLVELVMGTKAWAVPTKTVKREYETFIVEGNGRWKKKKFNPRSEDWFRRIMEEERIAK